MSEELTILSNTPKNFTSYPIKNGRIFRWRQIWEWSWRPEESHPRGKKMLGHPNLSHSCDRALWAVSPSLLPAAQTPPNLLSVYCPEEADRSLFTLVHTLANTNLNRAGCNSNLCCCGRSNARANSSVTVLPVPCRCLSYRHLCPLSIDVDIHIPK